MNSKAPGEASRQKIEHPALQNMRFIHFSIFLWVVFSFLAHLALEMMPGWGSQGVIRIPNQLNP